MGDYLLLPVYWNIWKQNVIHSSLNVTLFTTSFSGSQCLDTEHRSVLGYDAMTEFV
jgi:hypothetical protein